MHIGTEDNFFTRCINIQVLTLEKTYFLKRGCFHHKIYLLQLKAEYVYIMYGSYDEKHVTYDVDVFKLCIAILIKTTQVK